MGRSFVPGDFGELGENSGDFLKDLASDVANNVCSLYQSNPLGFIENPLSANPVSEFNRGLWDSICGSLPTPKLPPPPARPFSGGQCCDTAYKVDYTFSLRNTVTGTSRGPFNSSAFLSLGKVVSFGPQGNPPQVFATTQACDSAPSTQNLGNLGNENEVVEGFSVTAVTPVGGAFNNNCGDLPSEYGGGAPPPNNPRTFEYTPTGGGDTIDTNYEIDFFPDFRGPLVRLPDLPNVCLAFTAFGLEFDLCTNKPGEGTGGDIDALADKLDQLQDTLDEVADAADELANREPTQDTPPDEMGDEEGEKSNSLEECVSNLRFVKVVLTEIPPNANVETGLGGVDLIDDAGWLAFRVGNSLLPPQRILFTESLFEAPEGVECFSLKLNFGFKASVSKIVKADD